jgi:hypothetical protein
VSEFSESLHLRTGDPSDAAALLGAAGVAGYLFPPASGWVSFVYDADEPPAHERFDRIVKANRGLLVHWDYAEDHGCNVTLYEGSKRAGRLKVSFESTRSTFDRAAFVDRGLLSPAAAERIERWLAHAVPAYTAAEALGLPHYRWLAFDLVAKSRALRPTRAPHAERATNETEALYAGAVEVDARGAIRVHEPPLAPPPVDAAGTNRWDALARAVLRKWVDAGSIELEDDDALGTLADALSDVLAEEPTPEVIEEFLLDRSEVAEVFATGAELVRAARAP